VGFARIITDLPVELRSNILLKELDMAKSVAPQGSNSSILGDVLSHDAAGHCLPKAFVKLAVITQFYPPDYAATGQLIEELVTRLQCPDLQVKVFTGQPGYAFSAAEAPTYEQVEQLEVRRSRIAQLFPTRIRGKALNGVSFVLRSAVHLLKAKNRGDVLLLTTAPPFQMVLGYLIHLLFGTPYVCLLYDLYPDVVVELKVASAQHWLVRAWSALNRQIWRRAAGIVVLSATMKDRVLAQCPEVEAKISTIHSWADPTRIVPIPKDKNWFALKNALVEKFTVLYSGNMGRCHDMDTILAAIQLLQDDPIEFVFIGGGAKRPILQEKLERLGLTNWRFLPYQDKSCLPYSLTACDLALVSIQAGVEGVVAPSKLYSALAAGRPIAVICEPHSYLRPLMAQARCGAVFDNGDGASLASFIRRLAADQGLTDQLGGAGRRYLEANFTPEHIAKQYARVLYRAVLHPSLLDRAGPRAEASGR
jgi:glycosyltransferase involved in cell wall biosynthesis